MSFKNWLIISEETGILDHEWGQHLPTYHSGLIRASKKYPGFLNVNPPEFYGQNNRKVWHTTDGELGYSLLPEKDEVEIAGLYNLGKNRKGHAKYALKRAFSHGGNVLHAFESTDDLFSLPHYYHNVLGAQPTEYFPFDPNLAGEDWDYKRFGNPGLVKLAIPQEASRDPDSWLSKDHEKESLDQFIERFKHLKRSAIGNKMENKEPKKIKNRHGSQDASKEQIKRLVQAVDDLYFGPDEEPKYFGENGGQKCDMKKGPCSCGAWH